MSRIPEFRLIVQTDEGRVSRIGAEDAGQLLVQGPQELIHVHIGIGCWGRDGEWNAGDGALFVYHPLEARQVGGIGYADWTVLVGGDKALELEGQQACHSFGLVPSDETPRGLCGDIAAAQVVVVVV